MAPAKVLKASVAAQAGAGTGTWHNGTVAGPFGPGYDGPAGRADGWDRGWHGGASRIVRRRFANCRGDMALRHKAVCDERIPCNRRAASNDVLAPRRTGIGFGQVDAEVSKAQPVGQGSGFPGPAAGIASSGVVEEATVSEKEFHQVVGSAFFYGLRLWADWTAWPFRAANGLIRPPGTRPS